MSYCRRGDDSDVYVIGGGELECFGAGWRMESEALHDKILVPDCVFHNGRVVRLGTRSEKYESFCTNSRQEMISHLVKHREVGHKVPDQTINRLNEEIRNAGDAYSLAIEKFPH